jgi:hypothetical protein
MRIHSLLARATAAGAGAGSRELGSALEQRIDDERHGGYGVQGAAVTRLRKLSARACALKRRLKRRAASVAAVTHILRFCFKRYQAVGALVQNPAEFFVQNHLRQSATEVRPLAMAAAAGAALSLHQRLVHVNQLRNVADLDTGKRFQQPYEILLQ